MRNVKRHQKADRELLHETEKLMVQLRDGKKLIGVLRSWDQFGALRRSQRTYKATHI